MNSEREINCGLYRVRFTKILNTLVCVCIDTHTDKHTYVYVTKSSNKMFLLLHIRQKTWNKKSKLVWNSFREGTLFNIDLINEMTNVL